MKMSEELLQKIERLRELQGKINVLRQDLREIQLDLLQKEVELTELLTYDYMGEKTEK